MTDKEKIRAEVESIKAQYPSAAKTLHMELENLIDFIDSIPEEPVSEELEEAARDYCGDGPEWQPDRWLFIAGAQWKEQQMTRGAEPAEVGYWNQRGLSVMLDKSLEKLGFEEGDKVKLIIIKED